MQQTTQMLDALRRVLKSRGMTYRDVAAGLGISESSVKRIFAEESFTLGRLEAVCDLLDTNIYELARQTAMRSDAPPRELSAAQESALANNPVLLTYFYLLLTGWMPARIARRFNVDKARDNELLDRLHALGLIRRLPRNRVRLLTGRRIDWRKDGPVRRLYEARVKAEFLQSGFTETDELMRLESGELCAASVNAMKRKIELLAAEFEDYAEADVGLPTGQKRAFALLMAFRPWTFWSLVDDSRSN